jgi:hypothetical protein
MVVALLAGACSGSEPAALPTATLVTPSSTPASPLPPAPSASPTSTEVGLEDGRHFGYVKSVDLVGSPETLVFDLAEFLQGEAANEAAREDGVIGDGESVPNDYYIRNRNPLLRTLVLDEDLELTVVDWDHCCVEIEGDLVLFAAAFEEEDPSGTYRGSRSPYWLTVAGGRVVGIEEQYLP